MVARWALACAFIGPLETGRAPMGDAFSPVKGKCMWWREQDVEEDIHDVRLADSQRRVRCWCFVEGKVWVEKREDVPADCPDAKHCRYYIKNW